MYVRKLAMVGSMLELRVGEPTATYLASHMYSMMSEIWVVLTSTSCAETPSAINASQISRAMDSVECHMESNTTTAFSSV